ncbi:unnamed protein product [Calypogeia fissa]
MELEREGHSGRGAEIELASTTATVEIEEEGEEEENGSPWSARKRQGNGRVQSEDEHSSGGESFRSGPEDSSPKKLPLKNLTLASMVAAGIQFGWALQLSLLTPYIQTLGIEHAFSSFIWLCGPITGLVVQPCIGIWSDRCKSKWGRRRPFIVSGALMVAVSVTVIGFSADAGYILGDSHESCETYKGMRPRAAGIFVLGFWLLDLANNTVQGPARALLADLAGPTQRDSANAIFCLWMALGNILGFSTGASGLWYKWFPFLRSKACCEACANLKAAFLVAVVFLILCTAVTMVYARETPWVGSTETPNESEKQKEHGEGESFVLDEQENGDFKGPIMVPVDSQQVNGTTIMNGENGDLHHGNGGNGYHSVHGNEKQEDTGMGLGTTMVNVLTGVRKLPPSMKIVLVVMAFCWLSWFPFFLFDTDWMGREVFRGNPQGEQSAVALYDQGVRVGAFGLLLNSVVLAIGSLLIDPLCSRFGSKHVWALSNYIVFVCMGCTAIVTVLAGEVHQVGDKRVYEHSSLVKVGALILFTILGFPLAITYSVPYSLTAELIADSGGGQGLAMGILNLAVVIPQMVVALGAGPWDALFGGGNQPAFALASIFALVAGIIATKYLPRLSRHGYQRAVVHGFG